MSNLLSNAQQFNLSLTDAQLRVFARYSRELMAWNQQVNLTRITDPQGIEVKHFLDSLSVCQALPDLSTDYALIDVGTGAGFPGLPLKIVLPQLRLTLLESVAKKTAFLQHMVDSLKLTNVTIVMARAEAAGRQKDHREQYDVAVARAVAALPTLAEYTLPFVKVGGTVIGQKGQDPAAETAAAAHALEILGGKLKQIVPVNVPGLAAERHLIVIHKAKPTPRKYPRRPGVPAKKPL